MLPNEEIRSLCKKLRPIIGKKADLLWFAYLTANTFQAKQETEIMIQMLAVKHLANGVEYNQILLPPPSPASAKGEFHLGTIHYGKRQLYPLELKRENFIKHIGIFSITGGGKTNVAQLLALGLLGSQIPFLIIDWKRSYRDLRSLA